MDCINTNSEEMTSASTIFSSSRNYWKNQADQTFKFLQQAFQKFKESDTFAEKTEIMLLIEKVFETERSSFFSFLETKCFDLTDTDYLTIYIIWLSAELLQIIVDELNEYDNVTSNTTGCLRNLFYLSRNNSNILLNVNNILIDILQKLTSCYLSWNYEIGCLFNCFNLQNFCINNTVFNSIYKEIRASIIEEYYIKSKSICLKLLDLFLKILDDLSVYIKEIVYHSSYEICIRAILDNSSKFPAEIFNKYLLYFIGNIKCISPFLLKESNYVKYFINSSLILANENICLRYGVFIDCLLKCNDDVDFKNYIFNYFVSLIIDLIDKEDEYYRINSLIDTAKKLLEFDNSVKLKNYDIELFLRYSDIFPKIIILPEIYYVNLIKRRLCFEENNRKIGKRKLEENFTFHLSNIAKWEIVVNYLLESIRSLLNDTEDNLEFSSTIINLSRIYLMISKIKNSLDELNCKYHLQYLDETINYTLFVKLLNKLSNFLDCDETLFVVLQFLMLLYQEFSVSDKFTLRHYRTLCAALETIVNAKKYSMNCTNLCFEFLINLYISADLINEKSLRVNLQQLLIQKIIIISDLDDEKMNLYEIALPKLLLASRGDRRIFKKLSKKYRRRIKFDFSINKISPVTPCILANECFLLKKNGNWKIFCSSCDSVNLSGCPKENQICISQKIFRDVRTEFYKLLIKFNESEIKIFDNCSHRYFYHYDMLTTNIDRALIFMKFMDKGLTVNTIFKNFKNYSADYFAAENFLKIILTLINRSIDHYRPIIVRTIHEIVFKIFKEFHDYPKFFLCCLKVLVSFLYFDELLDGDCLKKKLTTILKLRNNNNSNNNNLANILHKYEEDISKVITDIAIVVCLKRNEDFDDLLTSLTDFFDASGKIYAEQIFVSIFLSEILLRYNDNYGLIEAILSNLCKYVCLPKKDLFLINFFDIFSYVLFNSDDDQTYRNCLRFILKIIPKELIAFLLTKNQSALSNFYLHVYHPKIFVLIRLILSDSSQTDMKFFLEKHFAGFLAYMNRTLETSTTSDVKYVKLTLSFCRLMFTISADYLVKSKHKIIPLIISGLIVNRGNCQELYLRILERFLFGVSIKYLGSEIIKIYKTLFSLSSDYGKRIENLLNYSIIINYDDAQIQKYISELYYLGNFGQQNNFGKIKLFVENKFLESNSNTEDDSIKKILNVLNLLKMENSDLFIPLLRLLFNLLRVNSVNMHDFLLKNDQIDYLFSNLIDELMRLLKKSNDPEVRLLCVKCLGEIGPIDPARIKLKCEFEERSKFEITSREFVIFCIDKLITSARNAKNSIIAATYEGAIHELMKIHLADISDNRKRRMFINEFTPDVQEILESLINTQTRYLIPNVKKLNYPLPLFGSNSGDTTFKWAYHWALKLISVMADNNIQSILLVLAPCLKLDIEFLLFLLPIIIFTALTSAAEKDEYLHHITDEMYAVLSINSIPPNINFSHWWRRLGDCKKISSETKNIDLYQTQCTFIIFTILDFLTERVDQLSNIVIKSKLEKFLVLFPLDFLSFKAYREKYYYRSLLYMEKYISFNSSDKSIYLKYTDFLLNVYAKLGDAESVFGLHDNFNTTPKLNELTLINAIHGNSDDAVNSIIGFMQMTKCYDSELSHRILMQCYLNMDQPFVASLVCKDFLEKGLQTPVIFNDYCEILWNLGDFKTLENVYDKIGSTFKSNWTWNMDLGEIMLNYNNKLTRCVQTKIDQIRKNISGELINLGLSRFSAYEEGYPNIVKLHILNEIEIYTEALRNVETNQTIPNNIFGKRMQLQLDVMKPDSTFLMNTIRVRKTILSLLKKHTASLSDVTCFINKDIEELYLKNIQLSRKLGNIQTGTNIISIVENLNPKISFIERAKLAKSKLDMDKAILILKQGIARYFTNGITKTDTFEDKFIFSKAKLLIAKYNNAQLNVNLNERFKNYKESIKDFAWEKGYKSVAIFLVQYSKADSSLSETSIAEVECQAVKYFGLSLRYGTQYIFLSMPKLLSLWLNFGSALSKRMGNSYQPGTSNDIDNQIKILKRYGVLLENFISLLPGFVFMAAFSQILSRICHPNKDCFQYLKEIIIKVLNSHPHQASWMFIYACNTPSAECRRRSDSILKNSNIKKNVLQFINMYKCLTNSLIKLCKKSFPKKQKILQLINLAPELRELIRENPYVMVPTQFRRTVILPNCKHFEQDFNPRNYDAFPHGLVFICDVKEEVQIMFSLQRPKKLTFLGSDGKFYSLMCKQLDDLRLDARVMEFSNIINMYLRRDNKTRDKHLNIRTYSVVPLDNQCGLIEWVNNLMPYRTLIFEMFKKLKMAYLTDEEVFRLMPQQSLPLNVKRAVLEEKLLSRHPPVLDKWFFQHFLYPEVWYSARKCFIRTSAVMSIVGYIIGLGDRHGENLLIDTTNGDLVHVDYACLFNKSDVLKFPDRVPFRLTQNMVAVLGSTGCHGSFSIICEETVRVMTNHMEELLSVIEPFIYDNRVDGKSSVTDELVQIAKVNINKVKQRLNGIVSLAFNESESRPLSARGQVRILIAEATNLNNLCQMFYNWGPHL